MINFVVSDLMRTVIAVAAMLLVRACICCMTVTCHMPGIPSSPGRLHPPPLPGVCPRPPRPRGVGQGRGGHHEPGAEAAQAESGGWPLRQVAFITRTMILSHSKTPGLWKRQRVQKLTLIQQILIWFLIYPIKMESQLKLMTLGVSLSVTANFDTLRQKLLWNLQNNPSRQVQRPWK